MKFIPRLDVNFLDSTQIVDGRTDGRMNGLKVEPLYPTMLKAGAIKMTSVMALDGVTSFLRLEDVKNTCKCLRNSPTFGGTSSVQ